MRISDILKRKKEDSAPKDKKDKESVESKKQSEDKVNLAKLLSQKTDQATASKPESATASSIEIVKAMKEAGPDKEKSRKLYDNAVILMKEALEKAGMVSSVELNPIKEAVSSIVDQIVLGDKELLGLINQHHEKEYLPYHMVNVLILSIEIGIGLGYNKSKLNELGLGTILHDIGMIKVIDIACEERMLSEEEYNKIKKHPVFGFEMLEKIKDIPEAALFIVKQEHERIKGGGYPQGLKGDEIHEYAKIVALADTFEALTHARPHRKSFAPYEAVKEILAANGKLFDAGMLKIMLNRIGIYPIGSWIQLNSDEIGKVIDLNSESPLRPTVSIMFDSDKKQLKQIRSINLAKHPSLYIKKPLSSEEMQNLVERHFDS